MERLQTRCPGEDPPNSHIGDEDLHNLEAKGLLGETDPTRAARNRDIIYPQPLPVSQSTQTARLIALY